MMLELLSLIALCGLAVYKASNFFAVDVMRTDGPGGVFLAFRGAMGALIGSRKRWVSQPALFVVRWLACPYCSGLWLAALLGLSTTFGELPIVVKIVIVILAIAGIQTYMQDNSREDHHA